MDLNCGICGLSIKGKSEVTININGSKRRFHVECIKIILETFEPLNPNTNKKKILFEELLNKFNRLEKLFEKHNIKQ